MAAKTPEELANEWGAFKPPPVRSMTNEERMERIARLSRSPDHWSRFAARLEQDVLDARKDT